MIARNDLWWFYLEAEWKEGHNEGRIMVEAIALARADGHTSRQDKNQLARFIEERFFSYDD